MKQLGKVLQDLAKWGALAVCVVAMARCSQVAIVAEIEAHTEREKPIILENGCATPTQHGGE